MERFMEIQTFRASSMPEALDLIRSSLGPDATLLSTKEVRTPGVLGWLSSAREIEVTASLSAEESLSAETSLNAESSLSAETSHSATTPSRLPSNVAHSNELATTKVASAAVANTSGEFDTYREVASEIDQLEALMKDLRTTEKSPTTPSNESYNFGELHKQLVAKAFDSDYTDVLVQRIRNRTASDATGAELLRQAETLVRNDLVTCDPIQATPGECRVTAVVGPTGVGKTTTIAKLAANFRVKAGLKIGLITVDTFRIAAVEQLRTYADIMDLPMKVVSDVAEMEAAIASMSHFDLVLIDTAGRSPRDEKQLQELTELLDAADAHDVMLVLSCGASQLTLRNALERFGTIGLTSLVFTKLDEASALGVIPSLVASCDLPLSYVTDGQEVPDDIAEANAASLANQILRQK